MTKIEAQKIIDKAAKENEKIRQINDLQNEGGDGYEMDYDHKDYDLVMQAGYAIYKNIVFDKNDFETLRARWNEACVSLKGQKVNIKIIEEKSKVNYSILSLLKNFFEPKK